MNHLTLITAAGAAFALFSCQPSNNTENHGREGELKPAVVTERVRFDTDDPAIYINPKDTSDVLIIGTDKGGDSGEGGLYAFDLAGKIQKVVSPLRRPNNVDVAYGLLNGDSTAVDIAVCTERHANAIRVFSLPDLVAIDGGGIPVFEGEPQRDPMGIALYTDQGDGAVYAIVGRKTGPAEDYLWQYRLSFADSAQVTASLVRKFGRYSGRKEIEAIAVDNELGYVYYSDEGVGVRKYYAHPDSSGQELALFASTGFADDHEGISIFKNADGTGYLLVSDQQANTFHVFPREGAEGNPHEHHELAVIPMATVESDGSDVTAESVPGFPVGLFVAMSDNGTFEYYDWRELAAAIAAHAADADH